jgi:hypothetical protein
LPDTELLPEIAAYFGITIDSLFDYSKEKEYRRIEHMLEYGTMVKNEDFLKAERFLLSEAEEDPENYDAVHLLADVYWDHAEVMEKKAIEYAKRALRLKPGDIVSPCFAAKGADFDFIRSYQGPRTWKSNYCHYRWRGSYKTVAGVDVGEPEEYPFSVKPVHQVSIDDIKRGLKSHYEGMPWQVTDKHPTDGEKNIVPVCRKGTLQSMVCMFADDPSQTELHVAVGRPCETPYSVYRPLAGELPKGAATGEEAIRRLRDYVLPANPSTSL